MGGGGEGEVVGSIPMGCMGNFQINKKCVVTLGSVWLEEWKSRRIENGERMEKWEDRKDFNFFPFCLVESGKVKGWKK